MVDNMTNDSDIANLFSDKYKNLYNSVSYDDCEMQKLRDEINSRIESLSCEENCKSPVHVSVESVQFATDHLKQGKHDGELGYYSEHVSRGTPTLQIHLSLLLTAMLRHGYAPDSFLRISLNLNLRINGSL